ncbi:MAG TPA: CheR family methyltransferase [Stellaceae bacterium]|jgi:chemotaxis protein methyltransferase CheR
MSAAVDREVVARFRNVVTRRVGLHFDAGKDAFLADILRRHAAVIGLDDFWFVEQLENPRAALEWRGLIQELTVAETYFFRNPAQFAALRDVVRMDWAGRAVNVLSAGCASGEEPYSIAMTLVDCSAAISAIDVNGVMLAKAAIGRYSAWSLRETAAPLRARYFAASGNEFVLDPTLRRAVAFEERNLVADDAAFWRPEAFDVVFCRNVLMYFAPANARAAIARIARSLTPGGLLFLGHAETLRGLSRDFELRHTHGTFYYQRKPILAPVEASDAPSDPAWDALPPAVDGAGDTGVAWYEAIAHAAQRVRTIVARPLAAPATPLAEMVPDPALPVAHAMALMADEHYAEALALLQALPQERARQSDALFLRGVLLMHRGDLADAERICETLLLRDGDSAGAHYLMALCREAYGDRDAAALHDRHAASLDPGFAMPRLHLGLLARRAGDQAEARRELTRAATLLQAEEASRVLLFGGGFGREALLAMCRAELASADGTP